MKFNQSNIKKAKKYLDKNYCIGVPTETVYGLAANAYSNYAVKKIYKLKKRPISNPLIVHYSNISDLKKHISNKEFFYISDLLKNSDLKKNILFFEVNSKKTIFLVSIKKN